MNINNEYPLPQSVEGEFFLTDLLERLPIKSDMASMEHPIFSLSCKPDRRNLEYRHGAVVVKIIPSSLGLPTIYDKDILLYCASLIARKVNSGEEASKCVRISVNDFLKSTQRPRGGAAYSRFKVALQRLSGCLVETTIKTGNRSQVSGFGLIERYQYVQSHSQAQRLVGLEVTLCDWFYQSIVNHEVLTIDRAYFQLRKPLERRLYEIARKHCGRQAFWRVSLAVLHKKSGSRDVLKKFRLALRRVVESDVLPEYSYALDGDDVVTVQRKSV